MTAFASNILADLIGSGPRPGAGTQDAAGKRGVAGGFEALLAGMVAQQGEGAEGVVIPGGSAVNRQVTPETAAQVAAPASRLNSPFASPGAAPLDDEATGEQSAGAVDLAGAEAIVFPGAPVAEATVAARDVAGEALVNLAAAGTLADVPVAPGADSEKNGPATNGERLLPTSGEATVLGSAPATVDAQTEAALATAARSSPPAAVASPELARFTARVVESKSAGPRADDAASRPIGKSEAAGRRTADLAQAIVEVVEAGAADVQAESPVSAETAVAGTSLVDLPETPPSPASTTRRGPRAGLADRAAATAAAGTEAREPGARTVARSDASASPDATTVPPADEAVSAVPAQVPADAPDASMLEAPLAQPAVQASQAAAADPVAIVRGSPETVARLVSDIVRKLDGQNTRFDVQLDPLGLGKVDVTVEINADGRLIAALSFESAQAAADLRGRSVELRQALERAGFELSDSSLSFDMNNQGGGAERQQAGERFAAWSSRAFQTAQAGLEQADALLAATTYARTPNGGVDIRI